MTIWIANSKASGVGAVAALVLVLSASAAQPSAGDHATAQVSVVIPTTKILAIGHWTAAATAKAQGPSPWK